VRGAPPEGKAEGGWCAIRVRVPFFSRAATVAQGLSHGWNAAGITACNRGNKLRSQEAKRHPGFLASELILLCVTDVENR